MSEGRNLYGSRERFRFKPELRSLAEIHAHLRGFHTRAPCRKQRFPKWRPLLNRITLPTSMSSRNDHKVVFELHLTTAGQTAGLRGWNVSLICGGPHQNHPLSDGTQIVSGWHSGRGNCVCSVSHLHRFRRTRVFLTTLNTPPSCSFHLGRWGTLDHYQQNGDAPQMMQLLHVFVL